MAIITAVPRFPHPSRTMLCGYVSVCLHELQIIICVVVEAYRMNLNTDYINLKDEKEICTGNIQLPVEIKNTIILTLSANQTALYNHTVI